MVYGSWREVPPNELFRAYSMEPCLIKRDMDRLFDRKTIPHIYFGYTMKMAVEEGDENRFRVLRNAVIKYKLHVLGEYPI